MNKYLIMNVKREAYGKEDAAIRGYYGHSMTVGELREMLEGYDDDDVIVTSHDSGYTFGSVCDYDFDEVWEDLNDGYDDDDDLGF